MWSHDPTTSKTQLQALTIISSFPRQTSLHENVRHMVLAGFINQYPVFVNKYDLI